MFKGLKKILVSGIGLLMLAGVGAGVSSVKSAHASMFNPEYYHSTNRRDNVYYGIDNGETNDEAVSHFIYGRMPKNMRNRGHIFGLYRGKAFRKELDGFKTPLDKNLYRRHQTYYPDYVGYTTPHNKIRYHDHNDVISMVYINKRDVAKPLKNQPRIWSSNKLPYLRSIKYVPVHTYKRTKKSYRRTKRTNKRATVTKRMKRNRVRRRGSTNRKSYRWNRRTRKNIKRHYRKVRKVRRRTRNVHRVRHHAVRKSQDIVDREVSDVNQDREENGVSPLSLSDSLGAIASQRSEQIEHDFSHYDSANGDYYADEDANNLGDSHQ